MLRFGRVIRGTSRSIPLAPVTASLRRSSSFAASLHQLRIERAVDDMLVDCGVPREMIGAAATSRVASHRLPIDVYSAPPVSASAALSSFTAGLPGLARGSPLASAASSVLGAAPARFAVPSAPFSSEPGSMEAAAEAAAAAAAAAIATPVIGPSDELAFAWITPRSLIKGQEGGIIARLLVQPDLRLVGTRMFSPSEAFVDEYIKIHEKTFRPVAFKPFVQFIEDNLRPSVAGPKGLPNHVLFMLFSGRNARSTLNRTIGNYLPDPRVGMVGRTIRGAYGDFIRDDSGQIRHFQPAIVSASNDEANELYLELFSKYLQDYGGIFDTFYDRLDIHQNYRTGTYLLCNSTRTALFHLYYVVLLFIFHVFMYF